MRRALLLVVLVAFSGAGMFARPFALTAQTTSAQMGTLSLSTVVDWQNGARDHVLVSNNTDGELRLAENQVAGDWTSAPLKTQFAPNAVGAVWHADLPPGTKLVLEVRGGATPDDWGAWQAFAATDALSQDDGAQALEWVRPLITDTLYLQLRATLSTAAANASPVLDDISLSYFNTTANLPPSNLPLVPAAAQTVLTPAPRFVQRSDWNGDATIGAIMRAVPRGIVVHQIGTDDVSGSPVAFLRALALYDTQVLGWDDLPFHYIIDRSGTIYEGRAGGPTAAVDRLAGGDSVIHIALLGSSAPTAEAQSALANLCAWLGQTYAIPPLSQHAFALPQSAAVTRPNIAAHNDIVPAAADPSASVRDAIAGLRTAADAATVRSRWYFAEGNTEEYGERLAVLNPSPDAASVHVRLLRQPGPAEERTVTVAAGARFDLLVNSVFSDTTDVPAIVEANTPIIVERYLDRDGDIAASPGTTQTARVWYFAEGTTDAGARTYLVLFNPQSEQVNATVTYMKGDGTTAEQRDIVLPPQRRVVISVADVLPGVGFGTRVVTTQPIIAERTMLFGGSPDAPTGFHTSPGVTELARRWYFAEGTTQAPFQMKLLVLNPNAQRTNAAVTFQTADGTFITRQYAIPPTTRLVIDVNEVVPDLGVATTVDSDRPVAVERALYWNNTSVGTASPGVPTPAFTWRFADGRTSGDFQEFLLFNNPSEQQAQVRVEFLKGDGTKGEQTILMPRRSRYTMAVHQLYPGQQAIAATVRSTQPIVVERSLFPNAPTSAESKGGSTAFGVPEAQP